MIQIEDLEFEYFERDEEGYLTDMVNAIRGINFSAEKGQIIGICGRNGSGKSTFAKILNRLIAPIDGVVNICGYDAKDSDNILEIRKNVGMVFQNPDDQLIGTVVEEDVAFGAENVGIPYKQLRENVNKAVEAVGLTNRDYDTVKKACERRINDLSGGEKQKVSIAGVLAMNPKVIVLDESTSMLDPISRKQILDIVIRLNRENDLTVIMITHIMEELLLADTIYVFDKGRIALRGSKEKVFADREILKNYGLDVPPIIEISRELHKKGVIRETVAYSLEELLGFIKKNHPHSFMIEKSKPAIDSIKEKVHPNSAILFNNVDFAYGKKKILKDICINIAKGDYATIVGNTGVGKSTLLQLMPGLLKPSSGEIYVDGENLWDKNTDKRKIRCKIGFLFQYPEQQLFGKNVYEDVVFGPRNLGISEVQAESRAYEAIKLVGLPQSVYDTPMDKLSGGQRRRVALAGVLAMKPDYLILDEPTAGLDPEGKMQMLDIIDALHEQSGITIIMVTHDIEDVVARSNRVIVINDGKIVSDDRPINSFEKMMYNEAGELDEALLNVPVTMQLLSVLSELGMQISRYTLDMSECADIIKRACID